MSRFYRRTVPALVAAFAALMPMTSTQGNAQHPFHAPMSTPSSPVEYIPQPFDVLGYELDFEIEPPSRAITAATSTVTLRWVDDPHSGGFVFHLRDLTVDSVHYDGASAAWQAVGSEESPEYHFRVAAPAAAAVGDTALVRIFYHGTMSGESWGGVQRDRQPGGGQRDTALYALGVGLFADYVSATRHWLACYDHPSDKATFRARFNVPKGYVVASNGERIETMPPVPAGRQTYVFVHDVPTATYLLTFAASRYVPLEIQREPLPITIYSNVQDTTFTRRSFRLLPRMVSAFSERLVDYPFSTLGYVNTPKGAMEHQTMISFPTFLSQSGDSVNTIAAHELMHQWFGDLVSPLDFRHAWLTEAFATFGESLWAEELFGHNGYLNSQRSMIDRYINRDAPSEGVLTMYDFSRTAPSSNYPAVIYQKGAAVVGMLRHELGDSVFFAALGEYLRRHAYSTATTDSMKSVLESAAGRSLDWFFEQWIYGRGWPRLAISVRSQPNGELTRAAITFEQVQPPEYGIYRSLPVEIGFRRPDGTVSHRLVRIDSEQQTVELDSLPEFTSITVNQGPTVRTLLQVASISGVEAGVAQSDSAMRFVVHPNPASGEAVLHVTARGIDDCSAISYEMYSAAGRRIVIGTADSCEFTIPILGFSSGAYILRFRHRGLYYDVPVSIAK